MTDSSQPVLRAGMPLFKKKFLLKNCLLFLERGEGRGRETSLGCLPYTLQQGLNPQPFGVWDGSPTNWATPAGILLNTLGNSLAVIESCRRAISSSVQRSSCSTQADPQPANHWEVFCFILSSSLVCSHLFGSCLSCSWSGTISLFFIFFQDFSRGIYEGCLPWKKWNCLLEGRPLVVQASHPLLLPLTLRRVF